MTQPGSRQRGFAVLVLVLILLAAGAGFTGLKLRLDKVSRAKVPGSSIIYVPSGKYLKYASLGYRSFLADLIYIWAIQYYSDYSVKDRFRFLEHIFSIIAELDPKYADPYITGALISIYEARDPGLAFRVLDMGISKNPGDWLLPLEAGHYAQLFLKDFALAQKYYKMAMEVPGAPDMAKRLYANAAFKTQQLTTAWETWLEVYKTTTDPRIKKVASNHLYQVKAAVDITVLSEVVAKYKDRFGRLPADLGRLVSAGLLARLPQDLDGKDYVYDPQTGEVKPATIPWKR